MKKCGNKKCSTSTGIHEGLTFGSGKLGKYGYWQYQCRRCAKEWDEKGKLEAIDRILSPLNDVQKEAMKEELKTEYWIDLPAWPYKGLYYLHKKGRKGRLCKISH